MSEIVFSLALYEKIANLTSEMEWFGESGFNYLFNAINHELKGVIFLFNFKSHLYIKLFSIFFYRTLCIYDTILH